MFLIAQLYNPPVLFFWQTYKNTFNFHVHHIPSLKTANEYNTRARDKEAIRLKANEISIFREHHHHHQKGRPSNDKWNLRKTDC